MIQGFQFLIKFVSIRQKSGLKSVKSHIRAVIGVLKICVVNLGGLAMCMTFDRGVANQ